MVLVKGSRTWLCGFRVTCALPLADGRVTWNFARSASSPRAVQLDRTTPFTTHSNNITYVGYCQAPHGCLVVCIAQEAEGCRPVDGRLPIVVVGLVDSSCQ